ncbi:MAG: hypothetical protein KBC02_01710 [Candidatus Pacebacteria bacterium]|nr:hypothetical protein [Candidatus Paceibacterota bacterium]
MNHERPTTELSPTQELKDFYAFLAQEMPEGHVGAQNMLPVTILGQRLGVVVFGLDHGRASFGIFLYDATYSRKSLLIDADGTVTEDTDGVIPATDFTDHEPDFSSLTNQQIALAVARALSVTDKATAN